jgi:cell filamentation protein
MLELQTSPVPGTFNLTHMCAIHRHLFQDVYEWAGDVRTAPSADQSPMNKAGVAYASVDRIAKIWSTEYSRVSKQGLRRGLGSPSNFSAGLARFWGEVNHAHAFREGNTRTQAVFFEQFCEHAGYSLDVVRFAPQHPESLHDAFVDARYYFQLRGDATPLAETLAKVISPLDGQQDAVTVGAAQSFNDVERRFPELRGMTLDPHGLGSAEKRKPDTDNDYNP